MNFQKTLFITLCIKKAKPITDYGAYLPLRVVSSII